MTIEIQLTRGKVAIVDDEDADLAHFKWNASFVKGYANGGNFVAARSTWIDGKDKIEAMHRIILSRMFARPLLSSELCDHINGDPLCNLRSNLRLATRSQNAMNKGCTSRNISGYKGVSWHKASQKWTARIQVNGKDKYLGSFDNPAAAFEAYCKAGREYHGEFFNPGIKTT